MATQAFSGSITITRVRGHSLPAADLGGTSDPYFVIKCVARLTLLACLRVHEDILFPPRILQSERSPTLTLRRGNSLPNTSFATRTDTYPSAHGAYDAT